MPPGSTTVPQKAMPRRPNQLIQHRRMHPVNRRITRRLPRLRIPPTRLIRLRLVIPRTPRPGRIPTLTTASNSPAAEENIQAILLPPQPIRLTHSSLPRTLMVVPRQRLHTRPQVLPLQATTLLRMVANTLCRNSRHGNRQLARAEEVLEPKTEDVGAISVPSPEGDFP